MSHEFCEQECTYPMLGVQLKIKWHCLLSGYSYMQIYNCSAFRSFLEKDCSSSQGCLLLNINNWINYWKYCVEELKVFSICLRTRVSQDLYTQYMTDTKGHVSCCIWHHKFCKINIHYFFKPIYFCVNRERIDLKWFCFPNVLLEVLCSIRKLIRKSSYMLLHVRS